MVDLAVGGLGPGELIGGGASSTVFAATRLAFGDRVAVKVLKQTLTDEQSRSHFQREARALAELADIPGVVAVLESGVNERGEPYLIFPLFQGSAQSDVNANGPMAPARAAKILAGAARAVHGGHVRGVIHRDLKPANLLLTNSDDIFVSDFGIAKLTDSSASASGWLGLTPAYAPPEALEGISGGVPGDVYSLGATLAALVIGAPPFSSTGSESPIALLNRVVNQPAPDLVAHGAPPAIAAVVAQAMAKAPADRHPTALAFAEALEAAASESSASAGATGAGVTAELNPPAAAPPPPPPAAAPAAAPPPPAAAPPPPPPAAAPAAAPPPPAAAPPPPAAAPAAAPPPAAVQPPAAPPPLPPAPVPAPPQPVQPAPPVPVANPPLPAAPVGPSFEPPPVLAGSQAPAPLIPPAPQPTTGGDGNKKVALGVGAAVAAAVIIGSIFAFGGGGESAEQPEPTAVVVEPTTAPAEPTSPPAPTAEPTAEPAPTAVPTAVPTAAPTAVPQPTTPALPAATIGGPIDVYPGGAGEVSDLAAAVGAASDGDVIRLSPGVHEVGDLIVIDKNVSIVGAGADVTFLSGQGNSVLFVEGTTGVTFRGFSARTSFIDETEEDDSRGVIQAIDAADLLVEGVEVTDSPGFGLVFVDSTVRVANSTVTNSALSGVIMAGDTDAQLANNTVTGSGNSGFVWFETSSGVAMGNTSDNNTFFGFTAEGDATPNLVGNSAMANELAGYRMFETSTATLRGNRSINNEESGFVWVGSAGGTASGNLSQGNELSGFAFGDVSAPTIVANVSIDNGEAGFGWFGNSGGTASANRADGNGIDGFATVDESTATLRANYGTGNNNDLFFSESSGATIDEGGVVRVELDGSGDTDDIASAVARAAEGDIVVIGPGQHEVDAAIALDRNITIAGDSPETTSINVASENAVLLVETVSLNIRDITLTSSFEPETDEDRFSIIELDRADDFVVDNIVISGSPGLGMGIFEASGAITNSTFTESYWSGVGVADRSDVTVASNTLAGNGQSGLVFFDAARGFVGANEARNNEFFGFSVQGAGNPEFVGNQSSENTSSGFAIAETSEAILVGNSSTNNESAGFVWFDTSGGSARANISSGNESSGFGISEQATPTLSFNDSIDNEVDGFTWFETSAGLAVGNLATGNAFDGFAAEDESTPDLTLNVSRDNERRSFNRATDANPVLTDNEFD